MLTQIYEQNKNLYFNSNLNSVRSIPRGILNFSVNNTTFFNNCVRLGLKYGLTFRFNYIIIKQIEEEIT
jgi:hypothetical protein